MAHPRPTHTWEWHQGHQPVKLIRQRLHNFEGRQAFYRPNVVNPTFKTKPTRWWKVANDIKTGNSFVNDT